MGSVHSAPVAGKAASSTLTKDQSVVIIGGGVGGIITAGIYLYLT